MLRILQIIYLVFLLNAIGRLAAQDISNVVGNTIPTGAKRIGPGHSRDGKKLQFNYFFPSDDISPKNLVATEFYEGEHLVEQILYKNGLKSGVQRTWYPDGKPLSESPYLDGFMDGTFQMWDKSGKLIAKYIMHHGSGEKRIYNSNGNLMLDEEYKNNAGNGIWVETSSIDSIISICNQEDGKIVGNAFAFYANNQISSIGCFSKDGVPNGPCIEFSKSGQVTSKRWFINGNETPEDTYEKIAGIDESLLPYHKDIGQYKKLINDTVLTQLRKFRLAPKVKIPLEIGKSGEPVPVQ